MIAIDDKNDIVFIIEMKYLRNNCNYNIIVLFSAICKYNKNIDWINNSNNNTMYMIVQCGTKKWSSLYSMSHLITPTTRYKRRPVASILQHYVCTVTANS